MTDKKEFEYVLQLLEELYGKRNNRVQEELRRPRRELNGGSYIDFIRIGKIKGVIRLLEHDRDFREFMG